MMMQNPEGLQLIDSNGVLSTGMLNPATNVLTMRDGTQVNQVNPGVIKKTDNEGKTTLMAPNFPVFPNQMASGQNRKKASLFDKFRSLPPDVLMRAGAATLGADNLPKGLSAAGKQYADFFKTQTPEAKLDRALKVLGDVNNLNKQTASQVKSAKEDANILSNMRETLFKFDDALNMLAQNPSAVGFGFATGLRDIFNVDISAFAGKPESQIRSSLQTLKIGQTLLNTAQTKGAISDTEMRIFASDQPLFSYSSEEWNAWLTKRRDALLRVINRLERGETVSEAERPTADTLKAIDLDNYDKKQDSWWSSFAKDASKSTVNIQEFNDADAILGIQ